MVIRLGPSAQRIRLKNYRQVFKYNRNKMYNKHKFPGKPDYQICDFVIEKGFLQGFDVSIRLPVYQRLDAPDKRSLILNNRTSFTVEFNITNIYNPRNIFYMDRLTNQKNYQLPFTPGLRLSYCF
ncbi:MAG: hypothetical protein JW861_00545 [Bacteroidales bacterium]|nr:hypothetical protein [Bacteroidales bacterium]